MYALEQTRGAAWGMVGLMSDALHSAGSQHKQAARDHEIAAGQHRTAGEFHDKRMLHQARLASESARECCENAHRKSLLACARSTEKAA